MSRIVLALGTSAGGVGQHVRDLAGSFVAAGHEVLVAAPSQVRQHFGMVSTGAGVISLEVRDRPSPLQDAAASATLRRIADGADIVHAHGLRVGALAALSRPRSTPLVVTLHNAAPGGRVAGGIHAGLERIVSARADMVLGVSRDIEERMRALGATRVEHAVIAGPPPRDAHRDRAAVRAELRVPAAAALAVTVGRLAPQKRQDLLISAVALAGAGVARPLVLAIAGDGPLRAALQQQARSAGVDIRLLGHRSDVPDLLEAADVVVSSADWEGQPLWLQEALHAGAAVVATDAGGTAAVLGEAAVIVPTGDVRALAAAIADVASDGTTRDRLRSLAEARSAELPTVGDAAQAALTAYAFCGVVVHGARLQ